MISLVKSIVSCSFDKWKHLETKKTIKLINSIAVIIILNAILMTIGLNALYHTTSIQARIYIILSIFIVAMLLIISYYLKQRCLLCLILISVPFLTYALISPNLPIKINGDSFAQVLSFSELYKREGNIVFAKSHSYFFQAPYLVYIISMICGITNKNGFEIILQYGLLFIGIVSIYFVYAFESLKRNISLKAILPISAYALIALAFIVDNGGLSGGLSYRLFGTIMVILAMVYCFQKGYFTGNQAWTTSLILIILTVGASLGSPMACIFLVLLFGIYSLITLQLKVYMVIPLTYMIYAGASYMFSLKIYIDNAWNGIIIFLQSLIKLEFEERVIPVHRVTTWIPLDSIILSISYLSLLLTATVCLFYLGRAIWTYKNEEIRKIRITVFVLMLFLLTVTAFTYIGASTLHENTSSDIRTIVIQFVAILLPVVLMVLPFKRNMNTRIFISALCLLFITGGIKDPFRFYPKSLYDPINVVEDLRCGKESSYWAASFLINKVSKDKVIVGDYPVTRAMLRSNSKIKPTFLTKTEKYGTWDIIAYNKNGLVLPSLYIKPEIYKNASKQLKNSTNINSTVIYDDGNNIMGVNK